MLQTQGKQPDPRRYYFDTSVPGHTKPPLHRLALHLFAICPNSASCERLFSTFGLILTKLRTRLGTAKLMDLAELKMHIRDEYIRSGRKKELRTRAFGVWNEKGSSVSAEDGNISAALIHNTGSRAHTPADTDETFAPSEDSNDVASTSAEQSVHAVQRGFNHIEQTLQDLAIGEASEPVNIDHRTSTDSFSVPLRELFDFTNQNWVEVEKRSAVGSLNDEEELYDILDLDAPGEEALDYDLDSTFESLITS
jgi:hypothetical protein